MGHEYVMTTYDYSGNYSVLVVVDGIKRRWDLPSYVHRMASKNAHQLIPILERECGELIQDVVEDIVLLRSAHRMPTEQYK